MKNKGIAWERRVQAILKEKPGFQDAVILHKEPRFLQYGQVANDLLICILTKNPIL
jgi:hypothetical protein